VKQITICVKLKNSFDFEMAMINNLNHKHPDSLRVFFMTEMWERYGFYVVQTLLVLYLTLHFKWDDSRAFELVGTFTAMTYISSLVGGWIADHFVGQKIAIIFATLILMLSYTVLALLQTVDGLSLALAGICVGTGLLKPNISSLLGNEYPKQSPMREGGFTIFYIGITAGIIMGSTLPNIIHEYMGWPSAFFSASIGMFFALIAFGFGIKRYNINDYDKQQCDTSKISITLFLIAVLYGISFAIFHYPKIGNFAFSIIVLFSAGYLIHAAHTAEGMQAKQNTVIALLCLISTLFWAFYFQMFSSFSLLITRIVEPTLLGIHFPAPYYVAVQSLGLVLFGLLLSRPKYHDSIAMQAIHIGRKFFMAMLMMTIAYTATTILLKFNHDSVLISPLYIIPIYLLISAGEILLSPIGLAAITLLSSPNKVSTMMGIFFVSLGTGGFLSGKLAAFAAIPEASIPVETMKGLYATAFGHMLIFLGVATVMCYFINLLIKSLLSDNQQSTLNQGL
jgi:POT family proton-dependent oligopeptide transporter